MSKAASPLQSGAEGGRYSASLLNSHPSQPGVPRTFDRRPERGDALLVPDVVAARVHIAVIPGAGVGVGAERLGMSGLIKPAY